MGSAVELILLLAAVAYIIVKYINIINNDTKIENQKDYGRKKHLSSLI